MTAGFQALVVDQYWNGVLVAGEVPGHLQSTAEVLFSNKSNPQMLMAPVWGRLTLSSLPLCMRICKMCHTFV